MVDSPVFVNFSTSHWYNRLEGWQVELVSRKATFATRPDILLNMQLPCHFLLSDMSLQGKERVGSLPRSPPVDLHVTAQTRKITLEKKKDGQM